MLCNGWYVRAQSWHSIAQNGLRMESILLDLCHPEGTEAFVCRRRGPQGDFPFEDWSDASHPQYATFSLLQHEWVALSHVAP
jgi:hypothetical protein